MRIDSVSGVRLNPSPAVEAFLFDFEKVAAAYEYNWQDPASYARRAEYLNSGGYKGDRKAVAAALRRFNQALGAGPETLANVAKLEEGALCVVTGQQAGIFAGPAYSVYKAITAVHLAREQSERLGIPVVPVFWIAGEDHDWREVSWVQAPHGDGMARLELKGVPDGDRRSVGLAPVPESAAAAMEEFIALLPESDFKAEVVRKVSEALSAPPALDPVITYGKPTLADWFGRLMTWLFEGTGLIILNPVDRDLRVLERPFFVKALERFEQVDDALGRGIERWQGLGFEPTVEHHLGNVNLFTYLGEERLPLAGAGEHYWIRGREDVGWSREEIIARATESPQLFSTNVVLRPVIQGFLLPDLAYVGGPGEVSYFGLYRDVFAALDQQMPVVAPRESFTLVEPPLARLLEKQNLTLPEVFYKLDERRKEFVEREDRLGLGRLFEEFRGNFAGQYESLVSVLLELDPTLRFVAEENRKQIAVQINKLEEKARQQHRKSLETSLRQFDRLKGHLFPDGLQERSVTVLPYLAKYGPDLVQRLLEATWPLFREGWAHRAVYLGD